MRICITIAVKQWTDEEAFQDLDKVIVFLILLSRWLRHVFYDHWFKRTEVEKNKFICLKCVKGVPPL